MSKADLEKITIRVHRGDPAKLDLLFPEIGYNKVIRTMVRNLIKQVEEKSQHKHQQPKINPEDINLDI